MTDREDLDTLFLNAGWQSLPTESCDAIYTRRESVVGLLLSETTADASERAGDAQGELRELRNQPENHYKDFYLAFLVRRLLSEGLHGLDRRVDDPYVCRKLLVERRDRPLSATIAELGLFLPYGRSSAAESSSSADADAIDETAWTRLRSKGVVAITDWLIDEEERRIKGS